MSPGRSPLLMIKKTDFYFYILVTVVSLAVLVTAQEDSLLLLKQRSIESAHLPARISKDHDNDGVSGLIEGRTMQHHNTRERWLESVSLFASTSWIGNSKEAWPELQLGWRTISAVILGGLGAALSSAGGLGGGGLFVPLFNLLLEFDAKTSAALSNFMILGGSLANLCINLGQRHPRLPHKPLIDFDVVLLLQPNTLLGISAGVILNVVLPEWAITVLLTLALSYMSVHSFKGALRRWKRETDENRSRRRSSSGGSGAQNYARRRYVEAPDFHHSGSGEDDEDDDKSPDGVDREIQNGGSGGDSAAAAGAVDSAKKGPYSISGEEEESLAQPLLSRQESTSKSYSFPADKALALAFTWFAFFAIQVLRGGSGSQGILDIPGCGWQYWLLTATQIPLSFCVTVWTIKRLHASHARTQNPVFVPEDGFVLKPESCMLFAWMALVAGMLGGMLGIGGGMIINPLLLTLGMSPQVTAGTCASMVFFSSSMSVVQYWLMGRVPLTYALLSALLCAIFSGIGVTLVHQIIYKYNRASLIVASVTIVMGLSALLMAIFGGLGVWQKYTSGESMGLSYPC